jgi:hypothetical protein
VPPQPGGEAAEVEAEAEVHTARAAAGLAIFFEDGGARLDGDGRSVVADAELELPPTRVAMSAMQLPDGV